MKEMTLEEKFDEEKNNGIGAFGCIIILIVVALVVMWIYSVKYMYGNHDSKAELIGLTEKDNEHALTFQLEDGPKLTLKFDEEAYADLKRKLSQQGEEASESPKKG